MLFNLVMIITDDGLVMHVHVCAYTNTWWRHDMETLPELLVFCKPKAPVTGAFPSLRASNAGLC